VSGARPLVTAADLAPRGALHTPNQIPRRVSQMGPDDHPTTPIGANGKPQPTTIPFVAADGKGDLKTAEASMPKGHYDRSKAKPRKKRTARPNEAAPGEGAAQAQQGERRARGKRGKGRKPRQARAPRRDSSSVARFGVFNDGSVHVDAPECKGVLTGKDVDLLVAFVGKLRAK
jgi:hypothetical protein